MRHFWRTIAGKTILFVSCILSLAMLACCVLGAFVLIEADFYTRPEELVLQDLFDEVLRSKTDDYFLDAYYAALPEGEVYSFSETGTNLLVRVRDQHDTIIAQSPSLAQIDEGNLGDQFDPYPTEFWFCVHRTEVGFDYWYTSDRSVSRYDAVDQVSGSDPEYDFYKITYVFRRGYPAKDLYWLINRLFHIGYSLRFVIYFLGLLFAGLALICFIALMNVSARRPHSDELYPGPLNKIPFDVLLAICITLGILAAVAVDGMTGWHTEVIIAAIAIGPIGANLGLGLCMSAAARIKQGTLISGSFIAICLRFAWRVLKWIGRLLRRVGEGLLSLLRSLPLIWRTALIAVCLPILELVVFAASNPDTEVYFTVWFLIRLVLIPAALALALSLRRLQKAGEALAAGDMSYHTDTKGMFWDFKRHGENLNSIAAGMSIAVEDRLKSERMKTELITNVSHDIKTPLTSIINYAGLIGNETCDNPTITEYAAVLVRQSERLKRLIEDLVEASKASTGNLEVNMSPCDASVFLTQAAGEYEEKLVAAQLQLIVTQPEESVSIMADGRRMWRIFDNLMNNICKYAMPGTRVYLSLEKQDGNAVITFKNTSREPLNMSAEELMERFVRGDRSRGTEGNGLGLSIARSIAELQGGKLGLCIDGDLFKAILTFPII